MRKRRRLWVDSRYQLGHMFWLGLTYVGVALLAALAAAWSCMFMFDSRMAADISTVWLVETAVLLAAVLAVVVIASLRHTHAVVGPIVKLRPLLEGLRRGDFPQERICFRRNDPCRRLEDEINLCIAALREHSHEQDEKFVRLLQLAVAGLSGADLSARIIEIIEGCETEEQQGRCVNAEN